MPTRLSRSMKTFQKHAIFSSYWKNDVVARIFSLNAFLTKCVFIYLANTSTNTNCPFCKVRSSPYSFPCCCQMLLVVIKLQFLRSFFWKKNNLEGPGSTALVRSLTYLFPTLYHNLLLTSSENSCLAKYNFWSICHGQLENLESLQICWHFPKFTTRMIFSENSINAAFTFQNTIKMATPPGIFHCNLK